MLTSKAIEEQLALTSSEVVQQMRELCTSSQTTVHRRTTTIDIG